jgi:hypothetical protein
MASKRLSNADKELLRSVNRFVEMVSNSSVDNEVQQCELISQLNYLSQDLTIAEYRRLADGWSEYNLSGATNQVRDASDFIFENLPRNV